MRCEITSSCSPARLAVMGTIELLDWWLREEPYRNPAEIAALLDRLVIAQLVETSPE